MYKLRESGVKDIVDFGKADPDHSTPEAVVKRLQETAADPENHHDPAFNGSLFFREHIANWYQERFGVTVDPETEIIALLGSKEGLFHISLAYSEVYYDEGNKPKSLLEFPGGKDVGVEFFTFSKTFNMAGWRLGAAVGNKEVINSLLVVQSHINSGIFAPIQFAGVTELTEITHSDFPKEQRTEYKRRRDYALQKFQEIGWDVHTPQGTVYLWVPTPAHLNGEEFASLLLDDYHVVVAPGTAFGTTGDRYVRLSLTTHFDASTASVKLYKNKGTPQRFPDMKAWLRTDANFRA